jgi:hypothetical protein
LEVTLAKEDWDAEAPACPECERRSLRQEFRPLAIVNSTATRARDLAQTIANEDYFVSDIQMDHRAESKPKVRYKDQGDPVPRPGASSWGIAGDALHTALASGREVRQKYGSGLDVLQQSLKDGSQPDLIEISKQRCMKIW